MKERKYSKHVSQHCTVMLNSCMGYLIIFVALVLHLLVCVRCRLDSTDLVIHSADLTSLCRALCSSALSLPYQAMIFLVKMLCIYGSIKVFWNMWWDVKPPQLTVQTPPHLLHRSWSVKSMTGPRWCVHWATRSCSLSALVSRRSRELCVSSAVSFWSPPPVPLTCWWWSANPRTNCLCHPHRCSSHSQWLLSSAHFIKVWDICAVLRAKVMMAKPVSCTICSQTVKKFRTQQTKLGFLSLPNSLRGSVVLQNELQSMFPCWEEKREMESSVKLI